MASKEIVAAAAGTPRTAPKMPLEDAIGTRKTLIIIERHLNMLKVLSHGLSQITDVPKGLKPVSSLAAALALIDEHRPDVVICDERFDNGDRAAPSKVLRHAKKANPDAKVVLYGTGFTEQAGLDGYDAVIDPIYPDRVQTFVETIASSRTDDL